MSKAKIPIIGVSHRVIFPGTTHRITVSNLHECISYTVSRGKKLTMFGVVTYKDPDKKVMHSYGTLVGIAAEAPVLRQESVFSGFFNGALNNFSRNEWQLIIMGVERFKILSISEDAGVSYASIKIEKDIDSTIPDKLVEELRITGKNYLKNPSFSESVNQE